MKSVYKFPHVIFDCDGVLLDSNEIKRRAIYQAAIEFVSHTVASDFTKYFCELNGVPRLTKAVAFFSDHILAKHVIDKYSLFLEEGAFPEPTLGARELLESIYDTGITVSVLSGGEQKEVRKFLKAAGLEMYCHNIRGGPLDKQENLDHLPSTTNALYVGDSEVDFGLAKSNDLEFIFISQYSQVSGVERFISGNNVRSCLNLKELKCLEWE